MEVAFSEQLRLLRKQKGLTQQELGDKIGTKRQNIANWEIGKNEPSLGDLIALAMFFNVTVDYLLRGKEEEKETERLKNENEKLKAKVLELILGKGEVYSEQSASELVLQNELLGEAKQIIVEIQKEAA